MEKEKVYYSGEQWGQCEMCGKITDCRESFCFSCADAQSIIGTGSDMYDRTVDNDNKWSNPNGEGPELPAEFANKRLKLLIKNGWKNTHKPDTR